MARRSTTGKRIPTSGFFSSGRTGFLPIIWGGASSKKEKVSPDDFFVTMAYAMGLDYNKKYLSLDKREISKNNEGKGTPIASVFAEA